MPFISTGYDKGHAELNEDCHKVPIYLYEVIMPDHVTQQHTELGGQLFEALFQNASLGILVINKEGGIVLANNFLLSLFDYSDVSDILGNKIEILIPERFHKHHVGDR